LLPRCASSASGYAVGRCAEPAHYPDYPHNTVRKIPPIRARKTGTVLLMSSETGKRALRAAAKVAFGAAFIGALPGCGGKVEISGGGAPINEPQPMADAAASAATGPDSAPPNGGLQCLGQVTLREYPAQSTPISAAEFACCAAYDNAHPPDASDAGPAPPHGTDPSLVNCCKAIIAGIDQGMFATAVNESVRACCWTGIVAPQEELWSHGFCAPWGPPMPPALTLELEAVA
jgi:hypothetical protein